MAGKLRGKRTVATLRANKRQALANKPRALPNTRLAWAEKLNDQVWADICAAAGRTPDAAARSRLREILYSYGYPWLAYDRERVADRLKRMKRMLKRFEEFLADYRAVFPNAVGGLNAKAWRDPWAESDHRAAVDLQSLEHVQQRLMMLSSAAQAWQRANAGKRSIQRELFYHGLCQVWVSHFNGKLKYSVPPTGGPPHGALIEFILAVFRLVTPEDALPSPETVRDAIDRERILDEKDWYWRRQLGANI